MEDPFSKKIEVLDGTDDDSHHKVDVRSIDIPPTNMTNWDTMDMGLVVAHKYGHMIGKFDEYTDPEVPGREHVNTGTIMDNTTSNFAPRQFTRFARNLGCFVCFQDGTVLDNVVLNGIAVPTPY